MIPVVDKFLERNDQYLPLSPKDAFTSGNFHQIPLLTGLTSLEAADSKGKAQMYNNFRKIKLKKLFTTFC